MAKRRKLILNENERAVLKFFLKFNIFAIPLYILLAINFDFLLLQRAVTDMTMALLHMVGIDAARDGLLISIPVDGGSWGGFISSDCVGWKSMLAYAALVMATEFSARKKLLGLALLPIIFAANLARIFFMFFYVNAWGLSGYVFVHVVIWTWGLLLIIIAVWIAWARYVKA